MEPTVGRIVHYYDEDGHGPSAAIITKVDGRCCDLVVFFTYTSRYILGVRQGLTDAATGEPGHGGVIASHWFWTSKG